MASCPAFDLWPKPELDASFPQVNYRLGHVVVPTLVLEYGVAMGEAEGIGDALRIEEVFGWRSADDDLPSHEVDGAPPERYKLAPTQAGVGGEKDQLCILNVLAGTGLDFRGAERRPGRISVLSISQRPREGFDLLWCVEGKGEASGSRRRSAYFAGLPASP